MALRTRRFGVLELGDLLGRLPHTLSGGQRQRVALGRALLCGPRMLLLDEPLAGVDEALRGRVLDYVEQVLKEWDVPTLYVTHSRAEADRLARSVVRLEEVGDGGRIGYDFQLHPRPVLGARKRSEYRLRPRAGAAVQFSVLAEVELLCGVAAEGVA